MQIKATDNLKNLKQILMHKIISFKFHIKKYINRYIYKKNKYNKHVKTTILCNFFTFQIEAMNFVLYTFSSIIDVLLLYSY